MPYAIETTTGRLLPTWCNGSYGGQAFWAVIFSLLIVFPLSLPRQLNSLRFTSAFSVLISFYIVLVIFFEAMVNRDTTINHATISDGFSMGY